MLRYAADVRTFFFVALYFATFAFVWVATPEGLSSIDWRWMIPVYALLLMLAAKLVTVAMPFTYKWATDALVAISGGTINNAAVLEFDFVTTGDSIKFRYVFGSEEYPEFVCSFNDAFGFFLSGPGISGPYTNGAINIALLPDGITPVTINNVNNGDNNNPNDPFCPAVNPQYYVNNATGTTVVYDGFTVVLEAKRAVQCGETYHIKLAIGDALDQAYVEWGRKPMGFIAYGGSGGARAGEHLRGIGIELQMGPLRNAVHIGGGDFFKVHPGFGGSGNLADIEGSIAPACKAMLDELLWWANATIASRG